MKAKSEATEYTLGSINDMFREGTIDKEQALALCNEHLDIKVVYAEDDDDFQDEDDCAYCPVSEKWYASDSDFVNVQGNRRHPSVDCHEDYADEIGFYCESNCAWYNSTCFTEIEVEGETICEEDCDVYFWQRDDCWHWEEEPDEDDIPDYHSQTRPSSWKEMKGFGAELEIYSERAAEFYKSLPSTIIGERDGSLDDEHGIELIGAPYTLEEYTSGNTPWAKVFEKVKTYDAYPEDDDYGIHVSLSKALFNYSHTPKVNNLHICKFVIFMNMQDHLCKLVAEREKIWDGNYKARRKVSDICNHWSNHQAETGKYEAVSVDGRRLEVRIFCSTNKYANFIKNVEYCHAVMEFTRISSVKVCATENVGTEQFLLWLKNAPGYKNLKKFLYESAKDGNVEEENLSRMSLTHFRKKYTKEQVLEKI